MTIFSQQTTLVIKRQELVKLFWSVPDWSQLAVEPASKGIVRHGDLRSARGHISRSFKRSYSHHAGEFLKHIGDREGETARPLLAWGSRNTQQNLGLPGWHSSRKPKLLCRPDEPAQAWEYYALLLNSGAPKGETDVALERIAFDGNRINKLATDPTTSSRKSASVEWAITGQPLVWDGEASALELVVGNTYDLRHIWKLRWEDWQDRASEHAIHRELMNAFMDGIELNATARGARLVEIADRHQLERANSYLHSSIGITADGDLVLLMKTGAIEELAAAHIELGSERAILLDNGGSVGAAYWSRRSWNQAGWANLKDHPVMLGNGSYFRPKGHSVLVAEVKGDIVEGPLGFSQRASR